MVSPLLLATLPSDGQKLIPRAHSCRKWGSLICKQMLHAKKKKYLLYQARVVYVGDILGITVVKRNWRRIWREWVSHLYVCSVFQTYATLLPKTIMSILNTFSPFVFKSRVVYVGKILGFTMEKKLNTNLARKRVHQRLGLVLRCRGWGYRY